MSKIQVCDLCSEEIMARYEDKSYRFTVKKRWWSWDGSADGIFKKNTKLDICFNCMRKIIDTAKSN